MAVECAGKSLKLGSKILIMGQVKRNTISTASKMKFAKKKIRGVYNHEY